MSESASSASVSGPKPKHKYQRENSTILSTTLEEEDSDEDYIDGDLDEDHDDGHSDDDDGDDGIVYIDEDESDVPLFPGEGKIGSHQVEEWQMLLTGDKAVPHALARPRVTRSERVSRGLNKRQRANGSRLSDTKTISPGYRALQFPNNFLEVRSGCLFCACCQSDIGLRKLSIEQHIRSATHKKNSLKKNSLISKRNAPNIEEAVDRIKNISTTKASSYRKMVCKGMLIGGVVSNSLTIEMLLVSGIFWRTEVGHLCQNEMLWTLFQSYWLKK